MVYNTKIYWMVGKVQNPSKSDCHESSMRKSDGKMFLTVAGQKISGCGVYHWGDKFRLKLN